MQTIAPEAGERTYRMKDLCELTGLTRQTIHFYVQQGLLAAGHKTGRNMAYYTDAHLQRLELIQRLQRESFLPLKAIKAVLDGELDALEPQQRELLAHIKVHLPPSLVPPRTGETVDAGVLAAEHGITLEEVRRLSEIGFIALLDDPRQGLRIPQDDTWAIELISQLRQAGLTEALGYSIEDFAIYEQVVSVMFEREKELVLSRMSHLPAEQVAEAIRRALPVVHALVAHYHTARLRNLFAAME